MTYPFWEYFLAIEDDLANTTRYVEFNSNNFEVYSVEFARILLSSSSEFDVVAKAICTIVVPDKKHSNINEYRETILGRFPNFHSIEFRIPRYDLAIQPWSEWKNGINPFWWQSYNNVKHERDKFFSHATLKNAIYSVAGLLAAILYYYRLKFGWSTAISPSPQLFTVKWYGAGLEAAESGWSFTLPD